jgi:tetratricopeptide (TPR) repeat protein
MDRPTLIGRERDLVLVARRVEESDWVTLIGPPGVGENALADAVALRVAAPLVAIDARRGIDLAAAQAGRPPGTKVLALAYAPLGLDAEEIVRLAPLDVPTPHADAAAVLASPAVELLLAEARRMGVAVRAPAEAAPALARVARRAGGLPLVLRAAAAGLALWTLDEVAAALLRPSTFPLPGGASLGERLGGAWAGLDADVCATFVRLAPHVDGAPIDHHAAAALRVLVDRGLALRLGEGAPRVRPLAPFAAAALDRAAREEARAARDAHLAAVAARVSELRRLRERASSDAIGALRDLAADTAQALDHAERRGDAALAEIAVRMALEHEEALHGVPTAALLARLEAWSGRAQLPADALVRIALSRAATLLREGEIARAEERLETATRLAEDAHEDTASEAWLALGAHLRDARRDYRAARDAFERAARSGDPLTRARAWSGSAGTLTWEERYGEAVELFSRAIAETRALEAPQLGATLATNLAVARIGHWPSPRARRPRTEDARDARRAAERFERAGERHAACVARQACGLSLVTVLRLREARAELEQMQTFARADGDLRYEAVAELDLGFVALSLGRFEVAQRHLVRGLELADAIDDRLLAGVAHGFVGDLEWERGEHGRARGALGRAVAMLEESAEHASRLALLLAQEAALSGLAPPSRIATLLTDTTHAHHHAIAIYAALHDVRTGAGRADDARVLPWLRAIASLMRTPEPRRGTDGLGVPPVVWLAVRRLVREAHGALRRELLERAWEVTTSATPVLIIDVPAHAVRSPDGAWRDLSRRQRPFALLEAIARPASDGGRTHTVHALVEQVWPGERMLPSAGANRVYAAAATLRKHGGLGDLIVSDAGGYRLSPQVEVVVYRDADPIDPAAHTP